MKFYCYLIILFTLTAKAQNTDSIFRSLSRQLNLSDTVTHSDLFLHIDKSVYTANENVWFAAYLMRASNVQAHHTLYITLVNEMDNSVVSSYKFALEQGLASASLSLPDSLLSGRYCLVAYTNKNVEENQPHIFRQPIDIIGLRKDPFTLQIVGSDQGNNILFTARVTKKEGKSTVPGNLTFTIIADGLPYKKFNETISNSGEVKFSIPAVLAIQSLEISGTINQEKEQMAFRRSLVWTSSSNFIKFFAPNGKLLAGKPSQVTFRAQNSSGQALSRNCVLLENNLEIGSFSTDITGNGSFTFTPGLEKQYSIKFKGENDFPIQRFPPIKPDTWNIRPISTVVSDTLCLNVSNPGPVGDCIVIIHNTRSMLYSAYLKLRKPDMLLKAPVRNWGAGIVHVCLFTKDGTLQEDRLVLIKNSESINAVLKPDSASYRPLSKVTLKLRLTNAKGEPVKGFFSFSSALENAVAPEYKNIKVFDLYERFLPDRILLPSWPFLKNEQNIQALLLKQENPVEDRPYALSIQFKPDDFDGSVLYYGKKPKKPVDMMLMGNQTTMLQSDRNGNFNLPYLPLRAPTGKEIMLSVLGKHQSDYKIEMKDRWSKVNAILANQNLVHDYFVPDELTAKERQLFAFNNISLKEVTISAKKTEQGDFYGKANSSGVCNDYVCKHNVLNCTIHPPVKKAIDGEVYGFGSPTIMVVYHCQYKSKPSYLRQIPPTITFMPFIPFNPADSNPPDIMNNTTLHWQAFIQTDEKGEATITFHNNARRGRFKAVVQGITSNEVFSSDVYFEVKP